MRPSSSMRVQSGLATSCSTAAAKTMLALVVGQVAPRRQGERVPRRPCGVWIQTSPSAWWIGSCGQPARACEPGVLGVASRPSRRASPAAAGSEVEQVAHDVGLRTDRRRRRSRLGTIGRRSQCVPESSTAVRKPARTHLYALDDRPPSSTLTYSPSIRSDGSVSFARLLGVDALARRAPRRALAPGRRSCTATADEGDQVVERRGRPLVQDRHR